MDAFLCICKSMRMSVRVLFLGCGHKILGKAAFGPDNFIMKGYLNEITRK